MLAAKFARSHAVGVVEVQLCGIHAVVRYGEQEEEASFNGPDKDPF